MGVSLNGGTPKSSSLIGFSIINHPFWGTTILGNPQIGVELLVSICWETIIKKKFATSGRTASRGDARTNWKRKIIWTKPPWLWVQNVSFQGVYGLLIKGFWSPQTLIFRLHAVSASYGISIICHTKIPVLMGSSRYERGLADLFVGPTFCW